MVKKGIFICNFAPSKCILLSGLVVSVVSILNYGKFHGITGKEEFQQAEHLKRQNLYPIDTPLQCKLKDQDVECVAYKLF